MTDFTSPAKECRSRKRKRCVWCGEDIFVGDIQVTIKGKYDLEMFTQSYHPECIDPANEWTRKWLNPEEGFDLYMGKRGCALAKGDN